MASIHSIDSIDSIRATQPHNPQPAELLQYLPAYKVVVCLSCRYAVQPDAISRHLKEIHHIHRSHRRPYMQYVSKLALDKPQNVIESEVPDFPVPFLPVQDGLQCASEGCLHLCASEKRMKSHWVSVHDRQGQTNLDWRPVPLQTFFRGNLLHYFTNSSQNVSRTNYISHFLGENDQDRNDVVCHTVQLFCEIAF